MSIMRYFMTKYSCSNWLYRKSSVSVKQKSPLPSDVFIFSMHIKLLKIFTLNSNLSLLTFDMFKLESREDKIIEPASVESSLLSSSCLEEFVPSDWNKLVSGRFRQNESCSPRLGGARLKPALISDRRDTDETLIILSRPDRRLCG